MSYTTIFDAAENALFQKQCTVATWKAAQDILGEDPSTQNYGARRGWATNILQGFAKITPRQLAVQVLRNATIAANAASATDGDIQFQVNSIISDLVAIG